MYLADSTDTTKRQKRRQLQLHHMQMQAHTQAQRALAAATTSATTAEASATTCAPLFVSSARGLDNERSEKWMMYAIEIRLHDLKFSRYTAFRPTASDMAVEADSDEYWTRMQVRSLAPRYPGKWESVPLAQA